MAVQPAPFITESLLTEIEAWKIKGCKDEDIMQRLRVRMVPPGYTPTPWTPGISYDNTLNS